MVSKVETLAAEDYQRKAYGALDTLAIQIDECRSFAEVHNTEGFQKCLREARETQSEAEETINPKTQRSLRPGADTKHKK
jgi:hypothetical protein